MDNFFVYFYLLLKKNSSEFLVAQRVKSNKQRAKSNDQRAKINKQRAKINKQRAKSNEQRAKSFASIATGNGKK